MTPWAFDAAVLVQIKVLAPTGTLKHEFWLALPQGIQSRDIAHLLVTPSPQ
jgi:hypothetical protein